MGGVAKPVNATVFKTVGCLGLVGSNPTTLTQTGTRFRVPFDFVRRPNWQGESRGVNKKVRYGTLTYLYAPDFRWESLRKDRVSAWANRGKAN